MRIFRRPLGPTLTWCTNDVRLLGRTTGLFSGDSSGGDHQNRLSRRLCLSRIYLELMARPTPDANVTEEAIGRQSDAVFH